MTDKYLCIHGHFYQPPRENPWLDAIEYQATASPYHDWNERITRECYGPNARARVHGQGGRILKLINNYEYMSFDFGPTLLSWLEKAHPWVYEQVLAADRAGRDLFQGHGNALAQVYNHIIMPLASRPDKLTQICWGLADFRHRFGRQAEGMWLAETAVDTETLNLMAQEGVKFTILSPTQAQSVRSLTGQARGKSWLDASGGRIDPTCPYRVRLDKTDRGFIDVFFYDRALSHAVAYEKILASGESLLERIEHSFGDNNEGPQLVSIATDGESYGHHYKFGELALSWLFHHLKQTGHIRLINYAFFLEQFPPEKEVKLIENSSWSCAHGVERWRSDCGCSVSQTPGWNQAWRGPLRKGLDWLAEELSVMFEEQGRRLFKDPWEAREDHITVSLDPSLGQREAFLKRHSARSLEKEEKIEAFRLLESQRMALYMFTSCGWFFDDISGLEAVQVLKYAARAMEIVEPWAAKDLEAGLIEFLAKAGSNDRAYGDGKQVYETLVKPSRIDPSRATAHYALASLGEGAPPEHDLFSQIVRPIRQLRLPGQNLHSILGKAHVSETGTGREFGRIYLILRRGWTDLAFLVGESEDVFDLEQLAGELRPSMINGDLEKTEEIFHRHLGRVKKYRLDDLIPETRKFVIQGLARCFDRHIKDYIQKNGALQEIMILLKETGEPVPEILGDVFRLLAADELSGFMTSDHEEGVLDWESMRRLADQARSLGIQLNERALRENAKDLLRRQMNRFSLVRDQNSIKNVINFLDLAGELGIEPDLWECQNKFYDLYNSPEFTRALSQDVSSTFQELGRRLGFLVETDT